MFSKSLVVLSALVAGSWAQVQVNTPASVQSCLPVQITWSGGKPPYFVGLIAGGQPSSPVLKDFGQQTGNSFTWKSDAPSGTSYTVQIRDSDGQINYSDQFTVQPSSQTCTTSVSDSGAPAATSNSTSSAAQPTKNSSGAATSPATNSTGKTTAGTTSGTTSTKPSTSNGTGSSTTTSALSTSSNSTASEARTSGSICLKSSYFGVAVALVAAIFI